MSGTMIEAEDLNMQFHLGLEQGFSLKQGFVDLFDPKRRREKTAQDTLPALSDLNFRIGAGEVVGLIGANGAGKSTLLKLVAGVLKPSDGRICVYGTVCPMIELGAGFDMDLTARENIYLNGAVMGYPERFLRARFDEIVAFSELSAFLDVPLRSFSSGMVARLAFSIATLVEPEILIVDEILSVGDLAFQRKSEEKMLQMMSGGTTVLYVSHSTASVEKLCSRVIWLEHGRIREDADPETVCRHYESSVLAG